MKMGVWGRGMCIGVGMTLVLTKQGTQINKTSTNGYNPIYEFLRKI
jgi:hypothetical protein